MTARSILTGASRLLSKVEQALLTLSIGVIFVIAVLTVIGILSRFGLPIRVPDELEIAQQLLMLSIVAALGGVTARQSHIAVDILYEHFGRLPRQICNVIASVAGLIFVLPLALWAFTQFQHSYSAGLHYAGVLRLPEWPARLTFSVCLFIMALRLILLALTGGAEEAQSDGSHPTFREEA